MTDLAQAIASAIQQQEGFGQPGAVTITANNNPGALISWPGFPTVNGFAQFPDYETGFAATVQNVQNYIDQGLTLSELTNKWAPSGAPNDPSGINVPSAYATFVSQQTGVPTNVPLNSLSSASGSTIDMEASATSGFDLSSVFGDLGLTSDPTASLASSLGNPSPTLLVGLAVAGLALWLMFKD